MKKKKTFYNRRANKLKTCFKFLYTFISLKTREKKGVYRSGRVAIFPRAIGTGLGEAF